MTQEAKDALCVDILRSLGHNPERPPIYLTEDEAATVLHVKRVTLKTWRCTGRHAIPSTKVGRAVYYRVHDLVDFLIGQTTEPINV